MKTVLVTGGAGFIGSSLTDRLVGMGGWRVLSLDSFDDFYSAEQKRRNLEEVSGKDAFRLLEGDIRDRQWLERALDEPIDVIVHLAARAGVRPSIQQPGLYQQVNIGGTMNLLELAREREIPHFVFASSSSVYGTNPRFPWVEEDRVLQPISPYAATKIAGELLGHTYSHLYGIRFIALRLFTVFGPRQRPDLAIHKFFNRILSGEPLPFYGDGATSRDYTYVGDIVEGIVSAMRYESPYEIINLGNNKSVTLSRLIGIIEKETGRQANLERLPVQPGDVPHTRADISRAAKLLGYQPVTGIEEGIRHFSRWYQEHRVNSGSV